MREKENARSPFSKDYEAKAAHEAARASRYAARSGRPQSFGDPLSGVVLVAEPPASAAVVDALHRSLAAVRLERAYVTWETAPDLLLVEVLSLEPDALVAIGADAARAVDSSGYPLANESFSGAPEGLWFSWTKGTLGLRLPAIAPAVVDNSAKRHFWLAFRILRTLTPEGGPHA